MSSTIGSTLDLTSLFSNLVPTSTASTLLGIITGNGSSGTGATNPLPALQLAERNQTQDIANTAKEPSVKRDVAAFTAAVTHAKSVTQLLANPDFQKVFLTANGLGSQIGYTALVSKALMSNLSDTKSLAAQLATSTSAWGSTVSTYNFYAKGLAAIQDPKVISTLASAYAEVTWRTSLDATTPGLSNALTFRAEASTITSVDQILGDPTMRAVVTGALGIPQQIAFQPLEAQERAISSRLDVSKLKNPKFVDDLIDQYLLNNAASNATTSSSTDLISLAAQAKGLVA